MPGYLYLTPGRRLLLSGPRVKGSPKRPARRVTGQFVKLLFKLSAIRVLPARGTDVLRKMCPSIHCRVSYPGIMWEANPGWPQPVGTPVSGGPGGLADCGSPRGASWWGAFLFVGKAFLPVSFLRRTEIRQARMPILRGKRLTIRSPRITPCSSGTGCGHEAGRLSRTQSCGPPRAFGFPVRPPGHRAAPAW